MGKDVVITMVRGPGSDRLGEVPRFVIPWAMVESPSIFRYVSQNIGGSGFSLTLGAI